MPVRDAIVLGIGLADNVSKELDKMASKWRARGRNLASVGSELTSGMTLPIIAAGAATLKFAGDLDALKKALAATMGSADAAQKEFLKLKEAAKAPGIGLEEAIQYSFVLQGIGASADQARHMMLGLAKAIELSGKGQHEFSGLMNQFQQMLGTGKILQQDIRFMKENAPALIGIMQDVFGTASPERLREMGVTVSEFVTKLIARLHELKGTGGSVRNSLENVWTSIRVGAGEIGLAILNTAGWKDGLESLSAVVDDHVSHIVLWIRTHSELTANIVKTLGIIAATGPLVRFGANIAMLASFAATAASNFFKLAKAILLAGAEMSKMSKAQALAVTGWAAIAAAIGYATNKLADWRLEQIKSEMTKDAETGKSQTMNRIDALGVAFNSFITAQFGKSWEAIMLANSNIPVGSATSKKRAGAGRGMQGLVPEKSPEMQALEAFLKTLNAPDDIPKGKKARFDFDEWLKNASSKWTAYSPEDGPDDLSGMRKFGFAHSSFAIPDDEGGRSAPEDAPIIGVMEDYADALKEISILESINTDKKELLTTKIGATRQAYMELATAYGINSEEAIKMRDSLMLLMTQQELNSAATEKHNKLLEFTKMGVEGLVDGITALVTEGSKGFAAFGKSVLKAVVSMLKMIAVEYILSLIKLPGVGAIAAAATVIPFIGGIAGSLSSISLAEGGLMFGESMVRAGEYPGVASNPEVISPVSKIQKYIREAVGSGGGGNFNFVIRGRDLHAVSYMANQDSARTGSFRFAT